MTTLDTFQQWVAGLPEILQYLAIVFIGTLPYCESLVASFAGVAAGINPVLSILLAIIGNFIIVGLIVLLAEKINQRFGKKNEELSPRRQKFNKNFEKYGVIGTSMLGWLILPSHLTSFLMITVAKVPKGRVMFWMTVSMIRWSRCINVYCFGVSFTNFCNLGHF